WPSRASVRATKFASTLQPLEGTCIGGGTAVSVPTSIGVDSSGKRWLSFAVKVKGSLPVPLMTMENDPSFAAVDGNTTLVREFLAETVIGLSGSTTAPERPT